MIVLKDINSLQPAAYNPRLADQERLDLVRLSLEKLGWLLPVYATQSGEILSGHQRHLVATQMGMTHVPVYVTPDYPESRRKALNILFNRATNDLQRHDTSFSITGKLKAAGDLRDFPVESKPLDYAPCLDARMRDIAPLLKANRGRWINASRNAAASMRAAGLSMPIVIDPDGVVVNGIGRLQDAAERDATEILAVDISKAEAEFARLMLNYLSMDFNIHERYADVLRHNSFRRAQGVKSSIGYAHCFEKFKVAKECDLAQPATAKVWRDHYGLSVLDWGAGLLQDTRRLEGIGVTCVPFEPYLLKPGTQEIYAEASRELVRSFLDEVAAGRRFTSIFQNSVMNSVPFHQDRLHIVQIIAALCHPGTRVHATAVSTNAARFEAGQEGGDTLGKGTQSTTTFQLNYEPNVLLGDYSKLPKVQKYHTPQEWRELWATAFQSVAIAANLTGGLLGVVCSDPLPVNPAKLRDAINFEFELPYPDGSRMGLSQEALAAFSKRLDITI